MKKIILLFTLIIAGSSQLNGMDPTSSFTKVSEDRSLYELRRTGPLYPKGQDYMAMLPKEIKLHIIYILAQASTIQEAISAIRSLIKTSKEFNAIINDPITTRTIIRLLVQKFNAPSEYIALQLNTLGSQKYLELCHALTMRLYEQRFDAAERLLYEGADIDFQPADTYPMFCAPAGIITLLETLNLIFVYQDSIAWVEKIQEQEPMFKEGIRKSKQMIENYQNQLQQLISDLYNSAQAYKDIFDNETAFNDFISKIDEGKFQEAYAMIKPKEVSVYGNGITAFYEVGETDECVIGANLSLVMYAIAANQPTLLEWLLKHHANLDLCMGTGHSALQLAITSGKKEMIELLVRNGANVNQKNMLQVTGEMHNKIEKFRLLHVNDKRTRLPYTALDQDTLKSIMKDVVSTTPLIDLLFSGWFIGQKLYDLTKLLLDHGANPNTQDTFGETPLIALTFLKFEGFANIMKLLLSYGADPSIKDSEGLNALDHMQFEEAEDDPEREEKIQLLENAMNPKK